MGLPASRTGCSRPFARFPSLLPQLLQRCTAQTVPREWERDVLRGRVGWLGGVERARMGVTAATHLDILIEVNGLEREGEALLAFDHLHRG